MEDEMPMKGMDIDSAKHCALMTGEHRLASRIRLEFSKGLDLYVPNPIFVLLEKVKVIVA